MMKKSSLKYSLPFWISVAKTACRYDDSAEGRAKKMQIWDWCLAQGSICMVNFSNALKYIESRTGTVKA